MRAKPSYKLHVLADRITEELIFIDDNGDSQTITRVWTRKDEGTFICDSKDWTELLGELAEYDSAVNDLLLELESLGIPSSLAHVFSDMSS